VAAQALTRRALRLLRLAAIALGLAVLALLLSAWVGSSIPRNGDWRQPPASTPGAVEIMVGSNGVHTEIVVPLVTPQKDWRRDFPAADLAAPDEPYTHVAVSWGERAVFLDTPTWSDLRPATALRALAGSEALLHVAHYVRPAPGLDNRPLRLRADEYARLVRRIEQALAPPERRVRHPGYDVWDVFYAARGRYDWRQTCNQWTSDTLAAAGVRTGWWTPLAGGVMKWVPRPPAPPQTRAGSE
jgi:uncharacterized protein (TIGR02117 family)